MGVLRNASAVELDVGPLASAQRVNLLGEIGLAGAGGSKEHYGTRLARGVVDVVGRPLDLQVVVLRCLLEIVQGDVHDMLVSVHHAANPKLPLCGNEEKFVTRIAGPLDLFVA